MDTLRRNEPPTISSSVTRITDRGLFPSYPTDDELLISGSFHGSDARRLLRDVKRGILVCWGRLDTETPRIEAFREYVSPAYERGLLCGENSWMVWCFDDDLSERVNGLCQTIDSFSNLDYGWDGYEAPPINEGVQEVVKKFLNQNIDEIQVCPSAVPTLDGGVQLEWLVSSRELELEFESPDTIHYLKTHEEIDVSEEGSCSTGNTEDILELIRWVEYG